MGLNLLHKDKYKIQKALLFIGYVVLALQLAFMQKWTLLKTFWVLLASLVPFGTFYMDAKLFRIR